MAATYDLNSPVTAVANRSRVRLYARDVNMDRAAFEDEEWDVFIADAPSSNLRLAAAWGLRSVALDIARLGKWKDAGVSSDAAATQAVDLAKWLEMQAASTDGISTSPVPSVGGYAGGISIADKNSREDDTDRVVPAMRRALHRYPEEVAGYETRS